MTVSADVRIQLRKTKRVRKFKRAGFIVAMLSVAMLNFLVFYLFVNFRSILMAFQLTDLAGNVTYSMHNFSMLFKELTLSDSIMMIAIKNTLTYFAVSLLVITPLSLVFSYFLFKQIRGYRFFRIVFFLPSIINAVVLVILYREMVSVNGPLFALLKSIFGMGEYDVPELLADSRYATPTIIAYCIWTGFGVNLILFNGAMTRIPEDVIEYGRLEGVGIFRELFAIMIPMIWPTLSTIIIFASVGIFSAGGPILLFGTNGEFKTWTISYFIFDQVFTRQIYEYASAVGLFFSAIGLPVVLLVRFFLTRIGTEVEY